jgi:hypothetical protein
LIGGRGDWEKRRLGEGENGRRGDGVKGRLGEGEKGRLGEGETGKTSTQALVMNEILHKKVSPRQKRGKLPF